MKVVNQEKNNFFLRFDKGEEVVEGLKKIAQENNIKAGSFQAIGAAEQVVLSYFNLDTKEYEDHEKQEALEIASLLGNVAIFDENIVIHAHATFARSDLSIIGGHVKRLVVSVTCEVCLHVFEQPMNRKLDKETGLVLLD